MGTRYKTQLYVTHENLVHALKALNDFTKLLSQDTVVIKVSTGEEIELACSYFVGEHRKFSYNNEKKPFVQVILPISLEDDAIIEYVADDKGNIPKNATIEVNNMRVIKYGYLSFWVTIGKKYSELNFMTVATRQNKPMLHSPSIHKVMKAILRKADSEIGLITTESSTEDFFHAYSIHNPTKLLKIYWQNISENQLIDFIPKAIKAQLDKE